jgi:hypothetical protein
MNVSTRFIKRRRPVPLSGLVVASVAIASFLAFYAGSAQAATGKSLTASRFTVTRISSGRTLPQNVLLNLDNFACMNMTDLPMPAGCGSAEADSASSPFNGQQLAPHTPSNGLNAATGKGAPHVPSTGRAGAGNLAANFNGLNDDTNVPLIGGHVTPPDQGLCVGPASALPVLGLSGNQSVVIEAVNEVFTAYDTSGNVLAGPYNLATLFNDPYASGDVSCNYDPATKSFFFTEIGVVYIDGVPSFYGTGIAVMNANIGYAAYGLDTGEGGYCLPDFPQHGFNDNAFYISINEFCGDNEEFTTANLYALSKSQLADGASSVNGVYWDNLYDQAGIPAYSIRPAIGDGTNTEYLLDSIAYGADGNSTNGNSLDFWQVTGGENITSGSGTVALSERDIPTEPYAFPVDATSTGDGSISLYHGNPVITSETYLDPVDSRLLQVQFATDHGATRLYTSLDSALTVGNDPTPVDGAAWFEINPKTGKINHQGYVGLAGTNLLFPSMVRSGSGTLNMGFSMTSPTLNPSTGYVVSKNEGNTFSPVRTTGEGSGPHLSFSPILYGRHRWGDYSAVALDPVSGNVWMADEYIPPADQGGSDPADNWGTRVWGLTR